MAIADLPGDVDRAKIVGSRLHVDTAKDLDMRTMDWEDRSDRNVWRTKDGADVVCSLWADSLRCFPAERDDKPFLKWHCDIREQCLITRWKRCTARPLWA